ncbi:MAG: hypothetical protein Q7R79_00260, partial [bacterium]|nr:hypothetical protein [bacterium]
NKRKKVLYTTLDINEYISKLHIQIQVKEGLAIDIARASQLTQKTNQCNLTTRRYTESDLRRMMEKGDRIITGEVSDTFGGYGVVILAILSFSKGRAVLDSFLMSCRVMGRGVEQAFLTYIIRSLHKEGVKKLSAQFIPTAKNKPAATMLPDVGFTHLKNGSYEITIPSAIRKLTALQRKRRIAVRG